LAQVQIQTQTISLLFSKQVRKYMYGNFDLAMQPCQSKFILRKGKANKILGNLSDFSKQVCIPNKFKTSSAFRIFNSNSVLNLNLIPKGMLLLIFYSISMQIMEILEHVKGFFCNLHTSVHFGKYKNPLLMGWA
jgi:hypothetical protein